MDDAEMMLTKASDFALQSFLYRWQRLADKVVEVHPEFAQFCSERGSALQQQSRDALRLTTSDDLVDLCACLAYYDYLLAEDDVEDNWFWLVEVMARLPESITVICDVVRE